MPERPKGPVVRAIVLGASVNAISLLPVFLTGAMAVQLTEALAFGVAGLGLATSIYRATGAVVSPYLGKLVDQLGVTRSIRLAAVLGGLSSLGLSLLTTNWLSLVGWLMLAGASQAFGRPAANRLLSNNVELRRLGTAFGIKNSAPPVATTIAGLSVPLIVLNYGWQRAYLMSAALACVVFIASGRRPPKAQRLDAARRRAERGNARVGNRRLMVTLAFCFGLGTMTSSVVTVFYVDSAVTAGVSESLAGTMLAVGSVAAIASRVLGGVIADRIHSDHLRLCAGQLTLGALGIYVMAIGSPRAMVVAVPIALMGAWGFNGIFWYALIRRHPEAPGLLTGALAPGALLGATVGPTMFGGVASLSNYSVAWLISGSLGLVAALGMLYSHRRLSEDGVSLITTDS